MVQLRRVHNSCAPKKFSERTNGLLKLGCYGNEQDDSRCVRERCFRPVESVDLPEKSEVEFEPRLVGKNEGWPAGFFQQTAGAFAGEIFERPNQGTLLDRDKW